MDIPKTWQEEKAERREEIVREYLAAAETVARKNKTSFKKQFAKLKGITYRTLDSWVHLFKDVGPRGLLPAERSRRGFFGKNPDIALSFEQKVMRRNGLLIKVAIEETIKEYPDRNLPSPKTYYNYMESRFGKPLLDMVQSPEKYAREHSIHINRDWNIGINRLWVGDTKQCDLYALLGKKPVLVSLVAFMDCHSRLFTGYVLTASPNSLEIGQAFYNGIMKHGVPKAVHIDRGKDYKSKYFSGEKGEKNKNHEFFDDLEKTRIPGILRQLNVEIIQAAPYNAKEKLIESNFGFLTESLRDVPGYRGHNLKTRPKKLSHEIKSKKLLSFEEACQEIENRIERRNNEIKHTTTKEIPISFYKDFVPQIPSQAFLNYLLMEVHFVKARNSGVNIDGHFYRGEDLFPIAGELVEVRRNPKDIGRVAVIHKNEYFGMAFEELLGDHWSQITLQNRNTAKKIRRKIHKMQKEIWGWENITDDPRRMEIKVAEEEALPNKEDISPAPKSNVISIIDPIRERISRKIDKDFNQTKNESEEARVAANGESRNVLPSRLLNALGGLSFGRKKPDDEDF